VFLERKAKETLALSTPHTDVPMELVLLILQHATSILVMVPHLINALTELAIFLQSIAIAKVPFVGMVPAKQEFKIVLFFQVVLKNILTDVLIPNAYHTTEIV